MLLAHCCTLSTTNHCCHNSVATMTCHIASQIKPCYCSAKARLGGDRCRKHQLPRSMSSPSIHEPLTAANYTKLQAFKFRTAKAWLLASISLIYSNTKRLAFDWIVSIFSFCASHLIFYCIFVFWNCF